MPLFFVCLRKNRYICKQLGGFPQSSRVVYRGNNNANANGGVANSNANNDASNSNTNVGSRLENN